MKYLEYDNRFNIKTNHISIIGKYLQKFYKNDQIHLSEAWENQSIKGKYSSIMEKYFEA